jgi:hypothetical protein
VAPAELVELRLRQAGQREVRRGQAFDARGQAMADQRCEFCGVICGQGFDHRAVETLAAERPAHPQLAAIHLTVEVSQLPSGASGL